MTYAPPNALADYLPINVIWDEDPEQFAYQIQQIYRNIADTTNCREIATYDETELLTGQQFFVQGDNQKKRQSFRKVINFGSLPNAGVKNVAHNITNIGANFTISRIYGSTSDTSAFEYRPLPWAANVAANVIELSMDATNIIIETFVDYTRFNNTYVIIEYLKN